MTLDHPTHPFSPHARPRPFTRRAGLFFAGLALLAAAPLSQAGETNVLFDGGQLSAFEFDPDHWSVGGEGQLVPRAGGGTAWALRRYGDFLLDLEFKATPGANSGVLIRVDNKGRYVERGLEIQVLDTRSGAVSKGTTGAIYDMVAPTVNASKPGEWNRYLIRCEGAKVVIELNGQKVVDADLDQWTEPGKNPDGSKNKYTAAGKDKPREGYIGLQDHQDKVSYRNIRVKPLGPVTQPDGGPAPRVEDGWEILFDGQDTAQWKLDPKGWVVRDGALAFLGQTRSIVTKDSFGDFVLEFEFKPDRSASMGGVDLRAGGSGPGASGLHLILGDPARDTALDSRSTGALAECAAPERRPDVKPGEWNRCKIVSEGSTLTATINDQQTLRVDLAQWTTKGLNPDGTKNRHLVPLKDWPRSGRIGFRAPLHYRNIRLTPLP